MVPEWAIVVAARRGHIRCGPSARAGVEKGVAPKNRRVARRGERLSNDGRLSIPAGGSVKARAALMTSNFACVSEKPGLPTIVIQRQSRTRGEAIKAQRHKRNQVNLLCLLCLCGHLLGEVNCQPRSSSTLKTVSGKSGGSCRLRRVRLVLYVFPTARERQEADRGSSLIQTSGTPPRIVRSFTLRSKASELTAISITRHASLPRREL
jgi:hypothetical protein